MGACIGRGPPPLPPSRPVGKDTVVKEAKAGGKGGWETAGLGAAHGSSGPSVAIMLPPSEAPFYCKVVLSKNDITVKYGEGHMLYPEEACYLVEKGALQILRNADAEKRFDEKVAAATSEGIKLKHAIRRIEPEDCMLVGEVMNDIIECIGWTMYRTYCDLHTRMFIPRRKRKPVGDESAGDGDQPTLSPPLWYCHDSEASAMLVAYPPHTKFSKKNPSWPGCSVTMAPFRGGGSSSDGLSLSFPTEQSSESSTFLSLVDGAGRTMLYELSSHAVPVLECALPKQ